MLPNNEHPVERALRVALGLVVVSLAFVGPWGRLGMIFVATGLIGGCPLYTLFGFSTCSMKTKTS